MIPTPVSTTVHVLRLVNHRQVILHVAAQPTLLGISVKMVSCPMVDYVLFAPFESMHICSALYVCLGYIQFLSLI